ncbi:MAG: hypothetical protein QM691_13080 [Opitutaceae bacterium]
MRTLLLFGSKVSPAPDVMALTKAVPHVPMYRMTCGGFARGQDPQPVLQRNIDYSRLVPRLLKRIQTDDSPSGFGTGVSILPIGFEQAAQSPWAKLVEGFLAS